MTGAKPKSHGRLSISASPRPRDLMAPQRVKGAWAARIVTLFPEAFPGTLGLSLTGKALAEGLWALQTIDLRPFGIGRHRNVDDTPAGGGAGMVLRADVVAKALDEAAIGTPPDRALWPVVYLSPRGKPFDQATARGWAGAEGITLLCGRFEGVDQRVLDHYAVEEVSGKVVLVEASPKGWKETGSFTLDPQTKIRSSRGRIWTHPVISHGKLYLRDQDMIYCYDVKAP